MPTNASRFRRRAGFAATVLIATCVRVEAGSATDTSVAPTQTHARVAEANSRSEIAAARYLIAPWSWRKMFFWGDADLSWGNPETLRAPDFFQSSGEQRLNESGVVTRAQIPNPSATTASGTLTATATTYNYSTAPWVITSGTGTYPDGGGTATFNPVAGNTAGTVGAGSTITVDVSPDLSQITYNSPSSYVLAAGTGTSIVADPTNGLTLNAANTVTNSPTTLFTNPNTISSPISGGGSPGVTKTGNGTVTLTGANTFTGGTHVNAGILIIAGTAANGDAVLGATGAGNDIFFNGGTLFTNVTGGLTTARNIVLGTNGGTIEPSTAFTTSGVVSGPGSLSINGFGAVAVTLTNTNTYTGATITSLSTASALTLSGTGSIATSSSYDLSGTLTLDNSGTTGINRISDTAGVTSRGALITTTGNAATASAETIGGLTLANGVTVINVAPGTAGSSLTTPGITRQSGSTLFVRGTNLGAAPGAGNSTILSTAAPATIGGGGTAGSTTVSVVPWALGNLTANTTSSTTTDIGSTHVAYDPTAGFRPLATTEYATTFGANATDNVRLTASTALTAGTAANALLFAPAATGLTLSGGPVNVTSGSVIYSPTATGAIAGTISSGLNFGAAEGVINYTNTLTVSGAITGSGGLTVSSPTASTVTLSGANTYTGTTTIIAGQTSYSGLVANDGVTAGAFGVDTSAITLNAGLGYALLNATAASTFNRNLLVAGAASPGLDYFGNLGGAYTLTMNGNIQLQHGLTVVGGASATTPVIYNGTISGAGGLAGFGTGYTNVFNGNNTFTGGVNAAGDIFILGSDTAFGTGTVFVSAASTFQGTGTAARVIPNAFVPLATPTFAGTAPLNLTGAFNLNGARTISVTDTASVTISGLITNGSLTKTGATALTLANPTGNTYAGGTVISTGTLLVTNTSGSATGTGSVSISGAGRVLGGTGFIVGPATAVASTSILQGGATGVVSGTPSTPTQGSLGALTLNSNLTLATGSIIQLFMGSDGTHGTLSRAGGTWTFAATQQFSLPGAGAGVFYDNIITGLAADPGSEGAWTFTGAGMTGTFVYDGTGNIDLNLTTVPEPATVLGGVLTAGLLGWGMMRRRRQA